MQFSCDSCKAALQIADEKVKGKRLLVRCKRCGAKITISDPALAAPSRPAPAPFPAAPAPRPQPAAAPSRPAPARAPTPAAAAQAEHDSDTESTRAMDSDILEKALRASKDDAATAAGGLAKVNPQNGAAPRTAPPPPPPDAPAQRDPAVWFAMIGGKQTGPMSRAEIGLKLAQAVLGPRTYLWKEGMASWARAKDVTELAALFGPPPEPKAPPPPQAPPAKSAALLEKVGQREFGTSDFGNLDLGAEEAERTKEKAEQEFSTQDFGSLKLEVDGPPPARRAPPEPQRKATPSAAANPFADPSPADLKRPAADASESRKGAESHQALKIGDDEEDATNVEQLPLGERVHQEQVASELFNSGEQSGGASAVDLARWASSELGKQKASQPDLKAVKKPPVPGPPTPSSLTPAKGSPAAAQRSSDPFAQVPDAPGLEPQRETTGDIVRATGVKKSRTPLLVAIIAGILVVLAAVIYALMSGDAPKSEVSQEVARPSLGGTGEKVELTRPTAAPAPAAEVTRAPSSGSATRAAKAKEPEKITADQEAAMKGLDNERGIGTHGPKAAQAQAAEAPAPESASDGLTAQDVRKKLDENKGALQGCIDDALRRDPNLRVGKILIATTIAPSGVVTGAKIDKRTVDESQLGSCLKRATRRIVFPSFAGDAFEVDIPIVVNSNQ